MKGGKMKMILYLLAGAIMVSTVSKITKEDNSNGSMQFGSYKESIETLSAILPAGIATEAMLSTIDTDTYVLSIDDVLAYIPIDR